MSEKKRCPGRKKPVAISLLLLLLLVAAHFCAGGPSSAFDFLLNLLPSPLVK